MFNQSAKPLSTNPLCCLCVASLYLARTPSPQRYIVQEEEAPVTVTMPIKRRNKATTIDGTGS